jgi:hypothetical protein
LLSIAGASFGDESLSMKSLPKTMCRLDTKKTMSHQTKSRNANKERQVEWFQEQGVYVEEVIWGLQNKAEALDLESSRSGAVRRHVKASCPASSCRSAQSWTHALTCTKRKSPDYSDFCCETRLTIECASRLSLDFLIILAHAFYSRFAFAPYTRQSA